MFYFLFRFESIILHVQPVDLAEEKGQLKIFVIPTNDMLQLALL